MENISNATVMSVSLYKKILVQVNIGKLLLKTVKIVKGQKYPIFGLLLGTFQMVKYFGCINDCFVII